MQHNWKPAIL